jgi:hypothetical protein
MDGAHALEQLRGVLAQLPRFRGTATYDTPEGKIDRLRPEVQRRVRIETTGGTYFAIEAEPGEGLSGLGFFGIHKDAVEPDTFAILLGIDGEALVASVRDVKRIARTGGVEYVGDLILSAVVETKGGQ